MIRIAVAEDDLSWAHQLQTYVDQYARESGKSFEVSLFADGEDLLEQYHGQFDLVFLDVQMRFLDGMATAELIRRTDPEVIIIFITNMAQYAIRGYEVDALDYMLKPVGYTTFAQRLSRALSRMRRRERTYITVPIKGGAMKLAVEDITFVESQGHRLIYHTARGRVCQRRDHQGRGGEAGGLPLLPQQQGLSSEPGARGRHPGQLRPGGRA